MLVGNAAIKASAKDKIVKITQNIIKLAVIILDIQTN